jgi:hypothetical protein
MTEQVRITRGGPKTRLLRRALRCMAFFLALTLAPACLGESLVVRVVNGNDGKPVPEQMVTIQFQFVKTAHGDYHDSMINIRTDADGEAVFALPEQMPVSLDISVELKQENLRCPCVVVTTPEKVIHEGLTVDRRRGPEDTSDPIQPVPLHIFFVARPPSKRFHLLRKVMLE